MSPRARRALVGLASAAAVLILPASALAAESLTVSPSSTQAGGNPTITETLGFAPNSGDTPKTVVVSLAPGLLENLNANPTCLTGSQQLTAACQIGTTTLTMSPGPNLSGNLYLVPAQSSGDIAGIESVVSGVNTYTGVSLNPAAPGGLNLTTPLQMIAGQQTMGLSATVNPTLNGQPFTRLPTSCAAATSTMSVTYYNGTPNGSASGSFTPTGCGSLPYAPTISAQETKDAKDNGATLAFSVTQAADEAATQSIALKLPSGLGINLTADVGCLVGTSGGCNVGTASATSPLVPNAALANGTVTLGGSASNPTITITFPPPFALTLVGDVSVSGGTVTFNNMPDLTLTSLNLNITGPNGQKAFTTKCEASNTSGTFTAWSGRSESASTPVTLVNCAAKPTATGSTSGLAAGHPGLKLTVVHGKGAPDVSSVSIGLPGGLRFSRSGIVMSKTCTTKGSKKKCTTTTLTKGLGIKGATAESVALKGGKLVIGLKKAVGKVTISLSGPVLAESGSLQTRVKDHKVKSLTVTLKVTDAKGTATSVPLKLKAH